MRGHARWIAAGAALGIIPAAVGRLTDAAALWTALNTPFRLAGEGLRTASLSGAVGNILSWLIVLTVCLLPALFLALFWGRGRERYWEDWMLLLMIPQLFALLYYLINPTQLGGTGGTGELVRLVFPFAACGTLLSTLVAWGVLRLLRSLNAASAQRLAGTFRPLLRICALLTAAAGTCGQLSGLLAAWASVTQGNTGAAGSSVRITLAILVLLAALKLIPDLLAALTLLWGADLACLLGRSAFEAEAVEQCQGTALRCRWAAQATVLLALFANLLQLLLLERLHDSSFHVIFPLLPLALSAGLFLLCQCLRRGQELQEDHDSII